MSVDHANIVNYFETYEDKRYVYLCMELCTGGELIENCLSKKISYNEKQAQEIVYQLLSALNHIHAVGLIHRDIKPENVMFDKRGGVVKFIDFGLACQFNSKKKEMAGTPYFIAPEVISHNYGQKCDIWSLGVVIYMMLTGRVPFNGVST